MNFLRNWKLCLFRDIFLILIGLRTPDNTVFLADCISSQATLEKYQVSFIYDVARYLETLDKVENMQADVFVPAHAEVTSDIRGLVASTGLKCTR